MSKYPIWPRMDRSNAENAFSQVSLNAGPELNLRTNDFDFSGIGERVSPARIQDLRDAILEIASQFGFKARRGYDQEGNPGDHARAQFDLRMTQAIHGLVPMRWSEAGSRDVWSWFSLALLPDVTHWRWKFTIQSQKENWNKERWIGSDLTRHTWGRYWWRAVQFQEAPYLLEDLQEQDFNQMVERADSLGANPQLLAALGDRLVERYDTGVSSRREVVRDSTKRLRRRLAFVNDAALDEEQLSQLISRLFAEGEAAVKNNGRGS